MPVYKYALLFLGMMVIPIWLGWSASFSRNAIVASTWMSNLILSVWFPLMFLIGVWGKYWFGR